MPPLRPGLILVALAALLALGTALWLERARRTDLPAVASDQIVIGGPFRMTDHTGRRVTDADFKGRPMLLYFGYTFCPDVCPTELATMIAALKALGAEGAAVRPVFATIDPARDTVGHLAQYVALFSPDLIGLTGTPEDAAAMAAAYRVYYAKREEAGAPPDSYLMDHSSFLYLVGADGRFRTVFRGGEGPEALANALRAELRT